MPGAQADKRSRLIQAADRLVYRQGFTRTTLADIAKAARVPLGNIYYYFKSKDDIGKALIEKRTGASLLVRQRWEGHPDPRERIAAFVQVSIDSCHQVARSGCPVGSLCTELHKDGGTLARPVTGLFADVLGWLKSQFLALGNGAESQALAEHVVSVLQGASLLTHSFGDPHYVVDAARRLQAWIRAMEAGKVASHYGHQQQRKRRVMRVVM